MYDKPENFINRELSWLKFNRRVLEEAADRKNPLLERLKFIAITSSNLDEFFMIRVFGIRHKFENGIKTLDEAGLTPQQQLKEIAEYTHKKVRLQYKYLKNIIEELKDHNIVICDAEDPPDKGNEWLYKYFH
jgi:polyphosphate kinase